MNLRFRNKKFIILFLFFISITIIALFFKSFQISYDGLCYNKFQSSDNSTLITALHSYYGEWEIVEDYGYHGIHKITEIEEFKIGKNIIFQEDVFRYENEIDISYPDVMIEIISIEKIQQIDGMVNPIQMGFDNKYSQYAKIIIYDYQNSSNIICNFYIINNKEIIIEGDVHHYFRAIKKF